jgi:hypothetical protein
MLLQKDLVLWEGFLDVVINMIARLFCFNASPYRWYFLEKDPVPAAWAFRFCVTLNID